MPTPADIPCQQQSRQALRPPLSSAPLLLPPFSTLAISQQEKRSYEAWQRSRAAYSLETLRQGPRISHQHSCVGDAVFMSVVIKQHQRGAEENARHELEPAERRATGVMCTMHEGRDSAQARKLCSGGSTCIKDGHTSTRDQELGSCCCRRFPLFQGLNTHILI